MNINTGGPHVLLFERDRQLAALLTSELQLTGYECHAARTAVEVFDAISRYPVRLVLVNMAQAAASRREFWVALDTQRRGRGVQVFTFQCTNIAGYGSLDVEERAQSVVDIEVDGMLGLMSLVEAVRARVPVMNNSSHTMPRIPKTPPPSNSYSNAQSAPTPSFAPPAANSRAYMSGTGFRASVPLPETSAYQPSTQNNSHTYAQSVAPTPKIPPATPPSQQNLPPIPPSDMSEGAQQQSYSDRIRAVLYPNQRTWSSSSGNTGFQQALPPQGSQPLPAYQNQNMNESGANDATLLQNLANGQSGTEPLPESGLAQLSRLLSDYRPATSNNLQQGSGQPAFGEQTPRVGNAGNEFTIAQNKQPPTMTSSHRAIQPQNNQAPMTPSGVQFLQSQNNQISNAASARAAYPRPTERQQQFSPISPANQPLIGNNSDSRVSNGTAGANDYPTLMSQSTPQAQQAPPERTIYTQPLRPAPIQDLPSTPGQIGLEALKRMDTLSRNAYGQSTAVPAPTPRVSQQQPANTQPVSPAPSAPLAPPTQYEETPLQSDTNQGNRRDERSDVPQSRAAASNSRDEQKRYTPQDNATVSQVRETEPEEVKAPPTREETKEPEDLIPNNATLIDIMESLPPMPPVEAQTRQAQPMVLNGRATRSLGSVLLAGHLVPENRLEVIQHVQRMLRGVDLNYQLGEILLMFKLLTPDQLLAASLVSYGMITTQQISGLGRIRQELHSLGLEYDLENLLILFRILTPEQVRESKSSWQG